VGRDVVDSGAALSVAAERTDRTTALTLWSSDGMVPHLSAMFEPLT
jgi:hypothetical protein